MEVYGLQIPDKALNNFELLDYSKKLNIPNFRGVFMRDVLPVHPNESECGIVNFNTSKEPGSHWVCYNKNGDNRLYFDSCGQITLNEVQNYLKSKEEREKHVIYRNTDIVQPMGTKICGHLCLYVLKSLAEGLTFRDILDRLTSKVGSGIKWTSELADELHKPLRHNFPKRYVFVRNVDNIWAADLVDMKSLSSDNDDNKYILMVMDVFSRYGWARPLITKSGEAVKVAFEDIFKEEKIPQKLWADKGTEFYNKDIKPILKKHKITLYSTENEEKCSVIERWNRTIKTQLWKYFTANGTHRWVDVLQPLIEKYNTTKHRSVKMTPTEARQPAFYQQAFKNQYYDKVKKLLNIPHALKKAKFKVGEKVRLAVQKDLFEKSYIINWSDKIYTIKTIKNTLPITYIVKDDKGKVHKGSFYEHDLQRTKIDKFRVEKVLDWKEEKGKRYGLVKWMDYDDSYNSWEPEAELKFL